MTFKLSSKQHSLLVLLVDAPYSRKQAQALDQRTLGSLFMRGLIRMDTAANFHITKNGLTAIELYWHSETKRKDKQGNWAKSINLKVKR